MTQYEQTDVQTGPSYDDAAAVSAEPAPRLVIVDVKVTVVLHLAEEGTEQVHWSICSFKTKKKEGKYISF